MDVVDAGPPVVVLSRFAFGCNQQQPHGGAPDIMRSLEREGVKFSGKIHRTIRAGPALFLGDLDASRHGFFC